MSRLNLVLAIALAGMGLLVAPPPAQAHFMLGSPSSWWSQLSDGSPQKLAPCGDEASGGTAATGTVNLFQSGQPTSVTVTSTVAHPGWWRISLREGSSSSQLISSFPDPMPLGAAGTAQQCTPAFIDNPVWSPTQPVLVDKLGLAAGSTSTTTVQSGTKTFPITIPASARCTSASPCTLQVLMIMTDHPAGSCNYHHCADMAAMADATDAGTTGLGGAGGATVGGAGGTGVAGGDGGGCSCAVARSTTPGAALGIVFTMTSLLARWRRRRR